MLETGLPPRLLEIELTETAIMADRDRALHVLRQIKALGVGVALDDFGTGYSSLQTLRAFPFDKIKLDRFFTAELGGSLQSTAIIRAVLALGKSLSIPVLAEGVETPEQLEILLREGCDEVQGFLLGYPEALVESEASEHAQPSQHARPKPSISDAA
jgi:EAL domain-containing protein (putative c-di-GMP-specific phosphodiesterase class I)